MTAQEFYNKVWMKGPEASDPRGDWPIRFAEAYAKSQGADLQAELEKAQQDLESDLRDWAKLAGELGCAPTREEMSKTATRLRSDLEQAKSSRLHTHDWYARHYGKLQEWARTELPEPYVSDFFCCIANGSSNVHDSNYFHMDTAAKQLLQDQYMRAEAAESELAKVTAERDELKQELEDEYSADKEIQEMMGKVEAENRTLREALREIEDYAGKIRGTGSEPHATDLWRIAEAALHSSPSPEPPINIGIGLANRPLPNVLDRKDHTGYSCSVCGASDEPCEHWKNF